MNKYQAEKEAKKRAFLGLIPQLIALGHEHECQAINGYGSPVDGLENILAQQARTMEQVWEHLMQVEQHPLSEASVLRLLWTESGLVVGGDTACWPTFVNRAMILIAEAGLAPSSLS